MSGFQILNGLDRKVFGAIVLKYIKSGSTREDINANMHKICLEFISINGVTKKGINFLTLKTEFDRRYSYKLFPTESSLRNYLETAYGSVDLQTDNSVAKYQFPSTSNAIGFQSIPTSSADVVVVVQQRNENQSLRAKTANLNEDTSPPCKVSRSTPNVTNTKTGVLTGVLTGRRFCIINFYDSDFALHRSFCQIIEENGGTIVDERYLGGLAMKDVFVLSIAGRNQILMDFLNRRDFDIYHPAIVYYALDMAGFEVDERFIYIKRSQHLIKSTERVGYYNSFVSNLELPSFRYLTLLENLSPTLVSAGSQTEQIFHFGAKPELKPASNPPDFKNLDIQGSLACKIIEDGMFGLQGNRECPMSIASVEENLSGQEKTERPITNEIEKSDLKLTVHTLPKKPHDQERLLEDEQPDESNKACFLSDHKHKLTDKLSGRHEAMIRAHAQFTRCNGQWDKHEGLLHLIYSEMKSEGIVPYPKFSNFKRGMQSFIKRVEADEYQALANELPCFLEFVNFVNDQFGKPSNKKETEVDGYNLNSE